MREKIFWDTWAFLALADTKYRYHQQAKDVKAQLEHQHTVLITTHAIMTELGNAVSKIPKRSIAKEQMESLQEMIETKRGEMIPVSDLLWQRAWELYHSRPDKEWGHTDCISFVVMRELGIGKAFTNDHHFEQAGFTILVKT